MKPVHILQIALITTLAFCTTAEAMSFLPDFLKKDDPEVTRAGKADYDQLFADKVVVKKSERRLYLIKEDKPVRTYQVALGSSPEGHKRRQGDGRTPEGRYYLDWRNPGSKFRKSLHVSYPNASDRFRARRLGLDPGGMIMIHGQPRSIRHRELQEAVSKEDWTQGCIAVSNMAIEEIWDYTVDGTPIEILP
ncbi:MAG: L,D-transpeptidase family protein [Pseudomonadota bacterium]|nr:L,D-transpeptidase family protein [Pseudomonadota bacterium]